MRFLTGLLTVLSFGAVICSGFCADNAMTHYVVSGYRFGTSGAIQPASIRTATISPATVIITGSTPTAMTATVADGYSVAGWQFFTSSPIMPGSTATLLTDSEGKPVTTTSISLTADPKAQTKYVVLVLSQTGGGSDMRVTPVGYREGTSGDLTDFSSSVVTVAPSGNSTAPVTLTATLAKDYELVAWQKYVQDPRVRSTSPYETVTVTDGSKSLTVAGVADVAWMYVTAVVKYNPTRTISARVSGFGKGTVKISPEKDTYAPGDTLTLTAEPEAGYAFVQWGDDAKATSHTRTVTVADSKTYVAYIEPVSITVNFSVEDDATLGVTSKRVTYKSTYGELPTPTRPGYAFTAWKIAGSQITAESVVNKTADVTATAVWGGGGLAVLQFDKNGGTGTQLTNWTVTVGETVTLPKCTYEKEGYTTDGGWSLTPNGTDNLTKYTPSKAGTTVLYAKYTQKAADTATLKFDRNGGDESVPEMTNWTVKVGTTVTLPACEYTKTGYTTDGWVKTPTGTDLVTTFEVSKKGDYTFYAKYTEKEKVTLTFDPNGGTGGHEPIEVEFGESVSLPKNTSCSRNGYDMVGWGEKADSTENVEDPYTVTKSRTLYARYEKNTNVVDYNKEVNKSPELLYCIPDDLDKLGKDGSISRWKENGLITVESKQKGWVSYKYVKSGSQPQSTTGKCQCTGTSIQIDTDAGYEYYMFTWSQSEPE